jgi:hypothetical protein
MSCCRPHISCCCTHSRAERDRLEYNESRSAGSPAGEINISFNFANSLPHMSCCQPHQACCCSHELRGGHHKACCRAHIVIFQPEKRRPHRHPPPGCHPKTATPLIPLGPSPHPFPALHPPTLLRMFEYLTATRSPPPATARHMDKWQ